MRKAHKRRFQKFCELADTQESSSEDPRRVTALLSEGTTKDSSSNDSSMSKRALKRVSPTFFYIGQGTYLCDRNKN